MAPGKYVVVPSTFNPGEEADFLIRLYSEKQNQAEYAYDHKYRHMSCKACRCYSFWRGTRSQYCIVSILRASAMFRVNLNTNYQNIIKYKICYMALLLNCVCSPTCTYLMIFDADHLLAMLERMHFCPPCCVTISVWS